MDQTCFSRGFGSCGLAKKKKIFNGTGKRRGFFNRGWDWDWAQTVSSRVTVSQRRQEEEAAERGMKRKQTLVRIHSSWQ